MSVLDLLRRLVFLTACSRWRLKKQRSVIWLDQMFNKRTSNDIKHISMVFGRGNGSFAFAFRQRLQHTDSPAVHIARQECDSNALGFCQGLELLDQPVPFFLLECKSP